jgi:CMP-N-acetylneuraminic acid synthetase
MDKILTIIPARKNSKRLPGKNVKLFNGLPLIEYILKLANKLPSEFDVVISTDDIAILKIAEKYNKIKFLLRPDELALDESPAIDYVKHVLSIFGNDYQGVLILQPTSPFTLMEDILGCVKLFKEKKPATVVSVVKVNHMFHPDKFKILTADGLLEDYLSDEKETAYQLMTDVYVRNCSIYLSHIDTINNHNKIIDNPCLGYEMPSNRSIDINDQLDFNFSEFLLLKMRNG